LWALAKTAASAWLTCAQLLEAGLCLALQQSELDADKELRKGGVLTPASGEGCL
jgi:hypothetical protein